MWMLDTNAFSAAMNGRSEVFNARLDAARGKVTLSAIVSAEIEAGLAKANYAKKLTSLAEAARANFEVLDWSAEIVPTYARMRTSLERAGTLIGPMDLLIAAHALHLNAVIVTANVREFSRVPGLRIENWLVQTSI
jgi:tRNA(fMet)-specific endonuclease VapC